MLRGFDNFLLSLADKVTTGRYNFVSLIVKVVLVELVFALSAPAADKAQYFVHLIFNSTLQLINGNSSDLQKLLKYFNGTAIVRFFRIPLAWFASWVTVVSNNLALHSKDLKLSSLTIYALKLVASSSK